MTSVNDAGNGKSKWIVGIATTIIVSLIIAMLTWSFSTVAARLGAVDTLRDAINSHEFRLNGLRQEFDIQRKTEADFQSSVRGLIDTTQGAMRTEIQKVADIVWDIRVQLGPHRDRK